MTKSFIFFEPLLFRNHFYCLYYLLDTIVYCSTCKKNFVKAMKQYTLSNHDKVFKKLHAKLFVK